MYRTVLEQQNAIQIMGLYKGGHLEQGPSEDAHLMAQWRETRALVDDGLRGDNVLSKHTA